MPTHTRTPSLIRFAVTTTVIAVFSRGAAGDDAPPAPSAPDRPSAPDSPKEGPTEDAPPREAPSGDTSPEDAPSEDTSPEDAPPEDTSTEEPAAEPAPGESPEPSKESAPPAAGGLTPPELVEYVEADYPEAAFAAQLSADVMAEIDIDVNGNVTDVHVLEPAGHGFDEAARAAMLRFKFKPAVKNGVPISARVTYRYQFFIKEAPAEPAQETAPPPPARLIARVLTMEDEPIPAAFITLKPTAAEPSDPAAAMSLETDEQGRFEATLTKAGSYRIEIMSPGYKPLEIEEAVVEGEERELVYRLELEDSEYEMVVRAKRPAREVTRREITAREINKIPGTGGDALRAVQNLAGVAQSASGEGEIPVRGSAHYESKFFLDSLDLPLLYHFGGLTSVINSDLLESIDFYPGNFSVRYGRATGGIVDVKTRAPKKDRFHAYIDADVWDVGVLGEGPIGDHWSVAATVRRSYIDGFMKALNLMGDDIKLTVAPRYYDFQLAADYHPRKGNNVRLFFYGTDDKWIMDWDDDGSDPFWGSGLDVHLKTYQGQAEWNLDLNDKLKNQLSIGGGFWGGNYYEGNMKQDWNVYPLLIREELTFDPGRIFVLRLGTDSEMRWAKVNMRVPTDFGLEGDLDYNFSVDEEWLTFDKTTFFAYPALYTELELTVIPRTQVILGVRGDYYSNINRWGADPRAVVRYELLPKTTLKAGVGLFHQAPPFEIADDDYGNPNLELMSSIHYSAGVEQQVLENIEVSLEGFYKDMGNIFTESDELVRRDGEMVPERYNNDAEGRAYGMELQIKHRPTQRLFGQLYYTLMKSERKDGSGEPWRLFESDQTHILTAMATVYVGWGIEVGFKFRLWSGTPYTPVLGSSYDADTDSYVPIYGRNNSRRKPLCHQLDLRIDKKWQWKALSLTAYLDIQNIYYQKLVADYAYSYNYEQREPIPGMPIIPSLGLKVEY